VPDLYGSLDLRKSEFPLQNGHFRVPRPSVSRIRMKDAG
jgi:hypothetical protein